jgi:hypothetical protein
MRPATPPPHISSVSRPRPAGDHGEAHWPQVIRVNEPVLAMAPAEPDPTRTGDGTPATSVGGFPRVSRRCSCRPIRPSARGGPRPYHLGAGFDPMWRAAARLLQRWYPGVRPSTSMEGRLERSGASARGRAINTAIPELQKPMCERELARGFDSRPPPPGLAQRSAGRTGSRPRLHAAVRWDGAPRRCGNPIRARPESPAGFERRCDGLGLAGTGAMGYWGSTLLQGGYQCVAV